MSEFKEMAIEALNNGVEATSEEFNEQAKAADNSTEKHGVKGESPLTEEERHKRIQSNFYGTTVNFMAAILAELSHTNEMLEQALKAKEDKKE